MTFWVKVLNHRIINQLKPKSFPRPKENIPNEISGRKDRALTFPRLKIKFRPCLFPLPPPLRLHGKRRQGCFSRPFAVAELPFEARELSHGNHARVNNQLWSLTKAVISKYPAMPAKTVGGPDHPITCQHFLPAASIQAFDIILWMCFSTGWSQLQYRIVS